jgi:hypothetical protein
MIPSSCLPLLARAPETRPRLTLNGLLAGFLVGISAAVVTPSAQAAVVMIDLNDTRNDGSNMTIAGQNAGLTSGSGVTILNWLGLGDAVSDITLILYNGTGDGGRTYTGFSGADSLYFAAPVAPNETDFGPRKFAFGESIDASLVWTQDAYNMFFSDTTDPNNTLAAPPFTSTPVSYVGFRFADDPGTNYHYGYLKVTWDGTDFEILSGAYESTVGTGIDAGDTVPDSSSTGLMGLLFAGAAVRQWRKSRR